MLSRPPFLLKPFLKILKFVFIHLYQAVLTPVAIPEGKVLPLVEWGGNFTATGKGEGWRSLPLMRRGGENPTAAG